MKRLIERERKRVKRNEQSVEYDAVVVTRWLQLVARQSALYNVNNRHQCFATAEKQVIQPFEAVPHFFGCRTCGRYHFCRGERESCEIYFSEAERCEVCLYSGRLLRRQDNLEADEYDEGVRASQRPESYHIPSGVKTSSSSSTSNQHRDWLTTEQAEQIKQLRRASEAEPTVEREKEDVTTGTLSRLIKRMTKKHDEPHSMEEQQQEEEEEEGEEEGEWEVEKEENDEWLEEIMQREDDRDGFNKNYHNNLAYNNQLFAFLWPVIHERKKVKKTNETDLCQRDLSLGQNQRATDAETGPTARITTQRDLTAISEQVRNKIRAETELIVTRLLSRSSLTKSSDQQQIAELVNHFTALIGRVTGLVYRSVRLREFASARETKSEKQITSASHLAKVALSTIDLSTTTGGGGGDDDLTEERAEQLLPPANIVAAMMLFALVEPLAFSDSMGIRIDVWHRDAWLHHTLRRHYAAEVERQKPVLKQTCKLLAECLADYGTSQPLWLRSILFPARLVQFDSQSNSIVAATTGEEEET